MNPRRMMYAIRARKRVRAALYGRKALWVTQRMSLLTKAEKEWRVRLLTGPDDRSITGRLMGDPRYLRSALYAMRLEERQ